MISGWRMSRVRDLPGRRPGILWFSVLCAAWLGALVSGLLVLAPAAGFSGWLGTRFGFAQLIAFPRALGIAGLVLVLVLFGLLRSKLGVAGTKRRLILSVGPLVVCAVLSWVLIIWPYSPPWLIGPPAATANGGRVVRIVTFNSQSTLTSGELRTLIDGYDPDLIALPEGGGQSTTEAAAGLPFTYFTTAADGYTPRYVTGVSPTNVLVNHRMGEYRQVLGPPTTFGTVSLVPAGEELPEFWAVHAAPPLPGLMDDWQNDLARVMGAADLNPDRSLILAGDFNATLRHGELASRAHLLDTAQQCGSVSGTWPAGQQGLFQTPIDHIFVTPDIQVLSCSTQQIGDRADHLAYVAEVRLP